MADPFEEYFGNYAAAFDCFDAERIASYFCCPCLMVNDEFAVALATPEEILQNMKGLLKFHRTQNVGRAKVSEIRVEELAENLAMVRVLWRVNDREGVLLWSWLNTYNLVDHGSGWKIAVSTTHPAAPPTTPNASGR